MAYTLPDLPYPSDALEPHIDAQTMTIHHGKHHGTYVAKVNDALKGTEWENKPIEEVLRNLDKLPADKQGPVRNNGGGHYNHTLFWASMKPGGGGAPSGELAQAIDRDLGGFEKFKEAFAAAAANRFGSGWAWLCAGPDGKLQVTSTANQDSVIMPEKFGGVSPRHAPLLGLDVWEHAYYLKYQNKRPDYVTAWWNTVNWDEVGRRYAAARQGV